MWYHNSTMGRKPHIKVYVSETERRRIREKAEHENRSASNYIRHKILQELPQEVEA